jgi:hypothetical protein
MTCGESWARNDGKWRASVPDFGHAGEKPPHSFKSYLYDFDTICQPSASFIATK